MREFKRTYIEDFPLGAIDVGKRFREDYGDLKSLQESYSLAGMMNPITVRKHPDPESEYIAELVAGGRRYYAAIMAEVKTVPVFLYDNLTEEELRIFEKIENAQRRAMTWVEEVRLDAEIHTLQMSRHEAAGNNVTPEDGQWNQAKTAEFLGKAPSTMTEHLKLARALDENPEIAQCTNISQARNYLKNMERSEKAKKIQEFREKRGVTEKDSSMMELFSNSYIVNDATVGIRMLKDCCADLVEIDPPYGVDYDKYHNAKSNTGNYVDVAVEEYDEFITDILRESYRIMKPNAWILLWFDVARSETRYNNLIDAGFKVSKIPLIWNKVIGGSLSNPKYSLAKTYEACYYARKGVPEIQKQGQIDVFSFPSLRDQYRIHPTERPLELMKAIFKTFAPIGANIVSPFLGSGVSIYAAYQCMMGCMGWDLSEENRAKFLVKCSDWENFNRKQLEGDTDAETVLSTEGS